MDEHLKEVYFNKYCFQCENYTKSDDEEPCCHCLLYPAIEDSHKPVDFKKSDKPHHKYGYFDSIKKIKPYLYSVEYSDLDYMNAKNYYNIRNDIPLVHGCTSIRNGDWYGRNLDWKYDNTAEFIVRVKAGEHRYASIGVAGNLSDLTDDFASTGDYSESYKILPFQMFDGINECGVAASTNVVPVDKGITKGTNPTLSKAATLCGAMLVRFILDTCRTAHEAVILIGNYISVYFPKSLQKSGYEMHFMVADENDTYVIEFINNEVVSLDVNSKPWLTNFFIADTILNEDGHFYTPKTMDEHHDAIRTNNITPYGSGIERWNYIADHYAECASAEGMRNILNDLKYTNAYTNFDWLTEFVGIDGLTVATYAVYFAPVLTKAKERYEQRSRTDGGSTWQTVHSSIYSLRDKSLRLCTQESDEEMIFKL